MAKSDPRQRQERFIDENLKRVYEEAMQDEVPDRFRDLLAALKQQDQENTLK